MKISIKIPVLFLLYGLLVLLTCTQEIPTHTLNDGSLEIRPLCKLAGTLTIDEIASAEALVTGPGIDGTLRFELLINRTDHKLYGTLKLPEGITSCTVVIRMYDAQERKIGEGSYSLTQSHFNASRCVTAEIGIESAKPRIDTVYARVDTVEINDSIFLRAAARDSFGGTIQKYEWKIGSGTWKETRTGDTTIVAPSSAQAYVCSLRVTDDDGNIVLAAVTITVFQTYTVTYDGNNNTGGTVPDPQIKIHDVNLTLATNSGELVRPGHIFVGWNTDANGAGTDYAVGESYTANSELTIFAKWVELQRTIVMKDIPAGTFSMGETGVAEPVHQVTLSAFKMQETEVTQEQYLAVMGTNPANFNTGTDAPLRPVEKVSWYDAVKYCNALSLLSGLTVVYDTVTWAADTSKSGYRLPTEAQWEYACRGGTTTTYWWGSNGIDDYAAWYGSNSGFSTHPVAQKLPNAYGLYDMSGNVWEWCNDWYGSYSSDSATNPTGPSSGSNRVIRGGSWNDAGPGLLSASRGGNFPDDRNHGGIGFRVALPVR